MMTFVSGMVPLEQGQSSRQKMAHFTITRQQANDMSSKRGTQEARYLNWGGKKYKFKNF